MRMQGKATAGVADDGGEACSARASAEVHGPFDSRRANIHDEAAVSNRPEAKFPCGRCGSAMRDFNVGLSCVRCGDAVVFLVI